MEQLTQNLKDGHMQLLEVPFPALGKGQVMVRNHYSVISAGTEGKTVKDARLSYIGKARSRQEEVKKVITAAKTHGVMKTYKMVMNKLESPNPLGYSCAGEVIEVADDIKHLKVGDFVACGGQTANHSEVVVVPKNLCVKINQPEIVKSAAFATIGAIALQGVRQAELTLGENCVVIGLGIVGQLTAQLLRASGINVIATDIDQNQVDLAKKNGFKNAFNSNDDAIGNVIEQITNGYGADAVIITAGTSSLEPVNFAGEIARKKAKVVIVGAVPTGFDRKHYFKKELDLRMSSSYGPGRYDNDYEQKGHDYPIGYVRWTENRNMEAFVRLIEQGQLDLEHLISHQFNFDNAKDAYQLIVDRSEHLCGIVLAYDTTKELKRTIQINNKSYNATDVNIGFIGAGSFAQNFLLPNLKNENLINVATARATTARNAADKFGFDGCTGNADEVINDDKINTIFIATPHNLHANYVIKALQANKNVFVEKPLSLTKEELEEIAAAESKSSAQVMVGFNRRFAPLVVALKKELNDSLPKAINYRINAGKLPADHWTQDPKVGGGRIIGEACHFIDLCAFIADSPITKVEANALKAANNLLDTVSISLAFENGSVASISYFSNGSKALNKEYLEVFCGGKSIVLDDYKTMDIIGKGKKTIKNGSQDKGHSTEIAEFLLAIKEGKQLPVSFADCYNSSKATFEVIEKITGA
ncbi:MAG: Gfo/Idh/MocA family oxidoreductase [Flavobacteriales bacterium]|nr:Gfo/Idh/MocA family oxidoreductase [Flavobacteriales bacterium]